MYICVLSISVMVNNCTHNKYTLFCFISNYNSMISEITDIFIFFNLIKRYSFINMLVIHEFNINFI